MGFDVLLDQVAGGDAVEVGRDGVPVVMLEVLAIA